MAAELNSGATIAVGAVQAAEAGPVEDGDLVGTCRRYPSGKAIEVERGQHEPRAAVTVVILAGFGCLRRNHGKPAGDAGTWELLIEAPRPVCRRQQPHGPDS